MQFFCFFFVFWFRDFFLFVAFCFVILLLTTSTYRCYSLLLLLSEAFRISLQSLFCKYKDLLLRVLKKFPSIDIIVVVIYIYISRFFAVVELACLFV